MTVRQGTYIVRWLNLGLRFESSYPWLPNCDFGDIPLRLPFLYLLNAAELGFAAQFPAFRSLAQGSPGLMAGPYFLVKQTGNTRYKFAHTNSTQIYRLQQLGPTFMRNDSFNLDDQLHRICYLSIRSSHPHVSIIASLFSWRTCCLPTPGSHATSRNYLLTSQTPKVGERSSSS